MRKHLAVLFFLVSSFLAKGQAEKWTALPIQLNDPPRVIFFDSVYDQLLIGGNFTTVNSTYTSVFAWNGDSVSFLPSSQASPYIPITFLRPPFGKLYAGGFGGLSLFTDSGWLHLDDDPTVSVLYPFDGAILAGGLYDSLMGSRCGPLGIYAGDSCEPLFGTDTLLKGWSVDAISTFDGQLVVAGNFDLSFGLKEIMTWNGFQWEPLENGIQGSGDEWVTDMVEYKGDLYVSGRFFRGPFIENHIARWDGIRWWPVGGGVQGQIIYDMHVFNDQLWVAGIFDSAGKVPAEHIARWNGSTWCGFKSTFSNILICLGDYENDLYVGGAFTSVDGDTSLRYLIKWNNDPPDSCGFVDYTGLKEETMDQETLVFPNPFSDAFTVVVPQTTAENRTFQVFDARGKLLCRFLEKDALDLTNGFTFSVDLPKGVYFLKILNEDGTSYSVRIVKS